MRSTTTLATAALVGFMLGGCAYFDAKKRTQEGGELDQQKAAAQSDLDAHRRSNTELTSAKAARQAEIEQNRKRIASLERDLKTQDRLLAQARKDQKVDQARYAELKGQLDRLQADTEAAQKAQQQAAASANPDAASDAAKARQLAELEQRKKALEEALGALTKR
jgi:predicted nuclease with TOPRIM domain